MKSRKRALESNGTMETIGIAKAVDTYDRLIPHGRYLLTMMFLGDDSCIGSRK